MGKEIYFSDNFFSAGLTNIYNSNQEIIGSLDLKSAFTSSVAILNVDGKPICEGKFRFFLNRWVISRRSEEVGELKQRLSFLRKRYEYFSYEHGVITIESEAFSREYRLYSDSGQLLADFRKVNGIFESAAFQLQNHSQELPNAELIAVVMGVHMINKRNSSAATSSTSTIH